MLKGFFTAGLGTNGPELLHQFRATRTLIAGAAAERRVRRQPGLTLTPETWWLVAAEAPATFPAQVDRLLQNLAAASSEPGVMTSLSSLKDGPLSYAAARDSFLYRMGALKELGFIEFQGKREDRLNDLGFLLTYRGWLRAKELDAAAPPMAWTTVEVDAGPSAEVRRAIAASETLVAAHGPSQGIDRLHTAIHAYLRHHCDLVNIAYQPEDSIMRLAKQLREHHPQLRQQTGLNAEPNVVVERLAYVFELLNVARNQTEGAHPNQPLPNPEALLVLNAARTLFQYLQSRLT